MLQFFFGVYLKIVIASEARQSTDLLSEQIPVDCHVATLLATTDVSHFSLMHEIISSTKTVRKLHRASDKRYLTQ